ncbi:MAG: hypothetical protein VXZ72_00825 [Chlamydiota bacterium]|nr:hypothetical protein [Chlamydiota bacterium]
MADATLLAYLQELVTSYDSTISTASGSSFRTKVIDPFLKRVGDSPLDLDLETFLADRIKEEVPDLDTSANSGIRDLVIRPMSIMLDPIRREINSIKTGQSLNDFELMTREELNSLLGNFFLSIQDGSRATGTVRVYYNNPQTAAVSTLTKFMTEEGLIFNPTSVTTITAVDMAFNQDGVFYYLDVPVQAAETGDTYNIPAGAIVQVDGIVGPTKVTNKLAFTSATNDETPAQAVSRARDSITIRNLATSRGIKTLIAAEYPAIDTIEVVGFGDIHMIRDVVTGPTAVSGVPGGFTGSKSLAITGGQSIHIGGKTDAYVMQDVPVASSIDITNVTDVGKRIIRSESGFTSATLTVKFYDNRGYFDSAGVEAGDFIRLGSAEYEISAVVSDTELTTSGIPTGLSEQNYEIIRYTANKINVSLYDLVAVDALGNAVVDSDGAHVAPVPGDLSLSALTDGADFVVKEKNVSSSNIRLPMTRVKTVGFLDPTQLTSLGTYVPSGEILLVQAIEDFSSGGGLVRAFFRDAVSCAITTGSIGAPPFFNAGGHTWKMDPIVTSDSSPTSAGEGQLLLDSTSTDVLKLTYGAAISTLHSGQIVVPGDYIVWGSQTLNSTRGGTGVLTYGGKDQGLAQIESVSAVDATSVSLTLRHDADTDNPNALEGTIGTFRNFEIVRGKKYTDMAQDSETGLYYMDFRIDLLSSSGPDPVKGSKFSLGHGGDPSLHNDIHVEGFRVRSDAKGTAFSVRESPHLEFTPYVLDQRLTKVSTAYAIRVAYDYTDTLDTIQDYVDADDNRIVSEDLLVKHFLPGMVRGNIEGTGLTAAAGLSTIKTAISDVAPTEDLEISDIVGALYSAGATQVTMPITLVVMHHSQTRKVTASIVKDSSTANRIQKFIPDPDNLTFTVKT